MILHVSLVDIVTIYIYSKYYDKYGYYYSEDYYCYYDSLSSFFMVDIVTIVPCMYSWYMQTREDVC